MRPGNRYQPWNSLEQGDTKVSTVEHLLAALVGMGVDNCLVEINGPEIPIID
ncbi:MAG TPA: UDP-3-O-acyl-N-acetylglucosamine deacetylase, partial [Ferruginibacter sp.]|nr:UDP-3-O-acyl-N-acetylglucosamine deacetylase [Ferruginibacter sp.]